MLVSRLPSDSKTSSPTSRRASPSATRTLRVLLGIAGAYASNECGRRILWGRLATSSRRPVSSRETSRISASLPSSPRASSAMTKAPIETPGSPRSNRARVPRETPMRSAKSAMGIRRFFLAIRRFRPKVRSARAAEGVIGFIVTLYMLVVICISHQNTDRHKTTGDDPELWSKVDDDMIRRRRGFRFRRPECRR